MRNRPRVLFVSPQPFFEWRGSPIRVKFNTMALDQLGYDVDLLTLPIGADDTLPPLEQKRVAERVPATTAFQSTIRD